MKNKKLAIIGATGLVGQTVLKVLEEKLNFLKEMFLDTPGNRKIFLVNFGF